MHQQDSANRRLITVPGLLRGNAGATLKGLLTLQSGYQRRVKAIEKKRNLSEADRRDLIHDTRQLSSIIRQLAARG